MTGTRDPAPATTREAGQEPGIAQFNVRMTSEMRRRFRVACAQNGTTAQEVITTLVSEWLAGQGQ